MREVQVFCKWKDMLESKTVSLGFQSASILSAANETSSGAANSKVPIKNKVIQKNQKKSLRGLDDDSSDSEGSVRHRRAAKPAQHSDASDSDSDEDVDLFNKKNLVTKPAGSLVLENPERPKKLISY